MVYGYGDHSKMKAYKREEGYKKWNAMKSRDDKAERYASRHMSSTFFDLQQELTGVAGEQERHVRLRWGSFDMS